MRFKTLILFFVILLRGVAMQAEETKTISLSGVVSDAQTAEALGFATVQLVSASGTVYGTITDVSGSFRFSGLPAGKYQLIASYLGYEKQELAVVLPVRKRMQVLLRATSTSLNEVVVTASESRGVTSSSRIDKKAMEHLQPTSFTDLLELLPGGKSADPQMGTPNLISLREAGATGEDISSLGVAFSVDGAPVNTDGNMQYIPGSSSSDKTFVSRGLDMRTLSTDNIESVEVIRGIPSVEYGNLTNGLVKINRKKTQTPLEARFKADQYSKLFSVGKGMEFLSGRYVLNTDLSYLDSKVDPRDNFENYKRITASARLNSVGESKNIRYEWAANLDYSGSFDDQKSDPDISLTDDYYKSSYDKLGVGTWLSLKFLKGRFFRTVDARATLSQEFSRLKETKTVSLDRPMAVPSSLVQGESDGEFLPYTYVANMLVDGKPMNANAKLSTTGGFNWLGVAHTLKGGAEWSYNKNFGDGRVYDITRPLNKATTTRPRSYRDIPATGELSFFAEEAMTFALGHHSFDVVAGVRTLSLMNLNHAYSMHGKVYADPRFNVKWTLPEWPGGWKFDLSAGLGWHSKSPTVAQLYPDVIYQDIVQLNYYHNNPEYRRINMMTYTWDNTNYELEPARNRKWEVRLGGSFKGHSFSVTYFNESMNNAFRDQSYYQLMPYKSYDITSIDGSTLTGPPDLQQMTYSNDTLIDTYSMTGNGSRIRKQGIEYQISFKRIESLKTKVTLNGAWMRTVYSNSQPFYKSSSILLNGQQLEYVGLYDWQDGSEKQKFNTNVLLDTYIPKLGLIFSTKAECTWFTNNRPLWNDGTPVSYVDKTGTVRPFTKADKTDTQLQHLVKTYSSTYFDRTTVPFALDINFKATKEFGKNVQLALFVNRILTVYPDYRLNNAVIKRQASPYFGMEMNIKL